MRRALLCLLLTLAATLPLLAAPRAPVVPAAAQPSAHFNAEQATNAWLATVSPAARARSDAYFEGGYWLLLWDFLATVAISVFLLETRISARMRDAAERLTRRRALQWFLYWIFFSLAAAVVSFPLTVYEEFFREHQYGLSNQTFGSWFGDQMIALALSLVLGGLAFTGIVAIVRRLPRTWHLWGTAAGIVFLIISIVIGPVFIAPLFNRYVPLQDLSLKNKILSLARASGIPADDVYEFNASRQSKRVSANVSGLFGTDRISLNDNLLNRCSPEGVLSTMGHEMGHYVMHHIFYSVLFLSIAFAVAFAVLRRVLNYSVSRWGVRWQVRGVDDVALLPCAVIVLSTLGFLFTPVLNTFTRTQEYEADIFGLNAARQPDGEAEVDLLLGEYRKLSPGPVEEFIFFDHPSGRTRIYAAMRWKAENLCLFDTSLPCGNPPQIVKPVPNDHSGQHEAPPQ